MLKKIQTIIENFIYYTILLAIMIGVTYLIWSSLRWMGGTL